MICFPNAKLNLGLDILRRRCDGYHDISTVMLPVNWCDVLEIVANEAVEEDQLNTSGRIVACPPEKNLVIIALNAVRKVRDFPPVSIFLHKVIPDGAGLGGGSADAAFTITTLNELFSLGLTINEMQTMAATIGADCPFFINNRPTICEGIGTELSPITVPGLLTAKVAIVKPDIYISTKEAYADVSPSLPSVSLRDALNVDSLKWPAIIKNDFEPSIFPRDKRFNKIKDGLYRLGARYASLSGSGSALYGIFDRDISAEEVQQSFPECDTFVGSFVNVS